MVFHGVFGLKMLLNELKRLFCHCHHNLGQRVLYKYWNCGENAYIIKGLSLRLGTLSLANAGISF